MNLQSLGEALHRHLPQVVRWGGGIARQLRHFDVGVSGKSSGSPNTDALTLADLTVQELLVSALRDLHPGFRRCRIEAEEATGHLDCFAEDGNLVIGIDPIDGTREYRDRTGNGYAVILLLRSADTVHYSLCYSPEAGPHGRWVEVQDGRIVCGGDDPTRPATDVLESLPKVEPTARPDSKKIYLIGFQRNDPLNAQAVTDAGLEGYTSEQTPGSPYDLFARGDFGGSLIHSPNVYDFPVALHIARSLGGDALWVHNREPVHFRELWNDDRADMLRLPGIVACSHSPEVLETLCHLARDWNPVRYAE